MRDFRVYNTREEEWVENPALVQLSDGWGATGQIYVDPETNDKITEATWESFEDEVDEDMKDIFYPNHKACDYVLLDFADADMIGGNYEVMWSSGLEDKKDNKIYRSDIIEVESRYNEKFIVKFKLGGFIARSIRNGNEFWLSDWTKLDRLIVGNKFDDPQLLKEVGK